jgi:hypothetical protein
LVPLLPLLLLLLLLQLLLLQNQKLREKEKQLLQQQRALLRNQEAEKAPQLQHQRLNQLQLKCHLLLLRHQLSHQDPSSPRLAFLFAR